MSTSETPNLHLVKPDYDELADIEVINENMDTIDAAVKAVQDSVSEIGTVRQSLPNTVTCAASGWTQLASVELSAGVWLVIAGGQFAANATGHRNIGLSLAATSTPTGRERAQGPATSGNSTTNISYCIPYTLSSTTTVYSWGGQSSGSTLDCTPWLYAVRIA